MRKVRKVIGALLLIALFGGMFIYMGVTSGWLVALSVWGITAVVIGVIWLAVHLLLTD